MSTVQAEGAPSYRMDRGKVLKAVVDMVRTHPVFLYQLVVFTRFPSLTSAGMVVVGLVANHLVVNVVVIATVVRSRLQVIKGCLDRLRGFTFRRHSMREFLEESVHEDIDRWYVRRLLKTFGMTRARLDDMVMIHVVTGPRGLAQLSCYSDPIFFDSYIFVPDPPEDTHGLRRFFVLHEIGHTQLGFVTRTPESLLWIWPSLFFLLWVAATAPWNTTTVLVAAAYLCVALVFREQWKRNLADMRLMGELTADCFAVGYLSRDELVRLAANRRLSLLLDKDMDALQNTVRLARLRENIDLALRGDDDTMLERTFSALREPGWGAILSIVGLVAVVGFCGAAPDPRTFWWMLGLVGALVVSFLLLFMGKWMFEGIIEHRLREGGGLTPLPDPAPAAS